MHRVNRSTLVTAFVALAVAGCQDSPGPITAPQSARSQVAVDAPLVLHIIRPRDTGPATGDRVIDWEPAANPTAAYHHAWVDPSNRGNPKLFVFLPGTGNRPVDYQLVSREAARLGYHVIGLMYQNNVGVDAACKVTLTQAPPRECSGDTRLEILDGSDPDSSRADVSVANSIDNRLTQLLKYLTDQYPDEGWSRFLDDDGPKWSQIAVGGQSQGAGQAALIAKLRQVDRVVMLSGPPDARIPDEVDAWVSIGKTPASKYYALYHQRDLLVAGIRANLAALEMERFGDAALVAGGEESFGGAHILATDLEPQGGYGNPNPHRSTARDAFTPLPAGCTQVGPSCTPLLIDAWRYLLAGPAHLAIASER
jgi:hypothetical protein